MAKKLLFYTKMNFGNPHNSGIKKKVFAQAAAFRQLGFSTDLLFVSGNDIVVESDNESFTYRPASKQDYLRYLFGGFLKDFPIEDYDALYVRHFLMQPLFLRLLERLRRRNPELKTAMEIPTFPYNHTYKNENLVKRAGVLVDSLCLPFLKKNVDRIVTFAAKPSIWGIPTIQTDNGVDTSVFTAIPTPAFDGQTLRLIGVANIQPWHGYDRLIAGMEAYYATPQAIQVTLDIIGNGAELEKLKEQTKAAGLENYVRFHGFLDGEQLQAELEKAHLGVSNLAFHRIGAAKGETSALKSREYAARGLPFITAYHDRGFPADYPAICEFPADDSAIDINRIISFYTTLLQNYPAFAAELRQFTAENLSWEAKLKPVADYFTLPA